MKNNNKDIKALTKQNIKKNGGFAAILFIICAFLIASITFVSTFVIKVIVLALPIIILPLLFSFCSLVIIYREGGEVTFTNFFKTFALFFSPHFRGTYNYIRTLAFSILIELTLGILMSAIVTPIYYHTNYLGFADLFKQLMVGSFSIEELENLLVNYEEVMTQFQLLTTLPGALFGSLYLFYNFAGATYAYFFNNSSKLDGGTLRFIYLSYCRGNRGKVIALRLKNLWFVYLCYILGFAGGVLLGYLLKQNASMIISMALSLAVFLSIGSFGFYVFAFEEAHYLSTRDVLLENGKVAIIRMMQSAFDIDPEKLKEFEKEFESKIGRDNPSEDKKNDA